MVVIAWNVARAGDEAGIVDREGLAGVAVWQSPRSVKTPFFQLKACVGPGLAVMFPPGGKSTVAAALALQTALARPGSPVLLLSPSLRQSSELFRKVLELYGALGRPLPVLAESALRLELANR